MSSRAVPFHCPYCGSGDLRPSELSAGGQGAAWECHACLRAFALKMLAMLPHPSAATTQETP